MAQLIGRNSQIKSLQHALSSDKPEMVALIGRRRVGKTFLVRQTYGDNIRFELTGLQNGSLSEQLQNFALRFARAFPTFSTPNAVPDNWLVAFDQLGRAIESDDRVEKPVVFLDELPWLGTRRSGFIKALGYFWNSWASRQRVVVVICGSAASWMIEKVVNDRGGLHNRITKLIYLSPFTLHETELFCRSRNINLPRFQLLQLYMVMGGIPMYLEQLESGKSAVENIQLICFERDGYLRREFDRLFASLFKDYEQHVKIIRALAAKRIGLPRKDLVVASKISDGGGLTRILEELEESGFITSYGSYKKKKQLQLYRLTDQYSLFYLTYIERSGTIGQVAFTQLSSLPAWKSWSGYAFETVCLNHLRQIKIALGISGVSTRAASFYHSAGAETPGAQIALLIERADHTINLCEAKFSGSPLKLTASLAKSMERKHHVFQTVTGSTDHLFHTLLTTFPPSGNRAKYGIDQIVVLDDLFGE